MKYEVTYAVLGLLRVYTDVVEANDFNDCADKVQLLVNQYYGNKPIRIILTKEIQNGTQS